MSWDILAAAVAEARAAVAEAAPDPETAAEGEAYVARVATAALGGAVLGHLFHADGLSAALPCQGGPNPDYLMRFAPVDPAGRYRLEGRLNDSERIAIGLYGLSAQGSLVPKAHIAFDSGSCAADGSFALDLGAGAGLEMSSDTRMLLIRVLHRDPAGAPANLRLAGGAVRSGLALATGTAEGALVFVARSLATNLREYLRWTAAARNLANRLAPAPPELADAVQGEAETCYFIGGFDLAPAEWLEVTMPDGLAGYWSLHAYNYWYEHLQSPGVHDRNARVGDDGKIRIAVGPELPGVALNRIDTFGRRRGAFICRIIGEGECPTTAVRRLGE
jgi:hypothetical protein